MHFFSKTSRLREHHLTLVSKVTSGLKRGVVRKTPTKKDETGCCFFDITDFFCAVFCLRVLVQALSFFYLREKVFARDYTQRQRMSSRNNKKILECKCNLFAFFVVHLIVF
jgi:hypothetical protein